MRIRRSAARLLGSAYSTTSATPPLDMAPPTDHLPPPPPPLPHLALCSTTESRGGGSSSSLDATFGERCELNRSAWDLIAELSLSDPQVEDDLVDKYFVHVTTRASWLFSPTVPAVSAKKKKKKQAMVGASRVQLRSEFEKKAIVNSKVKKNQNGGQAKDTKVRQEEHEEVASEVWNCKKNDGKGWQCHRKVSRPDSLCDYHFMKKRSYLNPGLASTMEQETVMVAAQPTASKPSTSSKSKPQKMKSSNDFNATEGFYYYAGFGFRNKRHYRSSVDDYVPIKQQEEEDSIKKEHALYLSQTEVKGHEDETNQTTAFGDDIMGIADIDEDSSDYGYNGISTAGSSIAGASNGGNKRKIRRKKQGRKPIKARSLMSLM
ncbi:hypothetical protein SETIT_9G236700v2 [Setaria italica]|uniref:WRC domain-containing protein n=1 Tax=Setaria italica TaxID=4555 RepID=K4ABF8_SETIT|nr:hypothetical protein SETIT_9G236700v2 [Setaria italica]